MSVKQSFVLKKRLLYCKKYDTLLIHISTDYVYDGRLNIPYIGIGGCEPRNKYGETKLMGGKRFQFGDGRQVER